MSDDDDRDRLWLPKRQEVFKPREDQLLPRHESTRLATFSSLELMSSDPFSAALIDVEADVTVLDDERDHAAVADEGLPGSPTVKTPGPTSSRMRRHRPFWPADEQDLAGALPAAPLNRRCSPVHALTCHHW